MDDARNLPINLGLELTKGSAITPRKIDWLWPGWLARRKLHLSAGVGGSGKTTIALDIASSITTGRPLPDGSTAPVGNVVFYTTEDDLEDTLVPRAIAAGADLDRISFITAVKTIDGTQSFDPQTDFSQLLFADFDLLLIDPISVVCTDTNDSGKVRKAIQPLIDLAIQTNAAILGISHFAKGAKDRPAAERVLGSQAWVNAARVVWVTVSGESEDESIHALTIAKSNIGPTGGGFKYSLVDSEVDEIETRKIVWGEPCVGSVKSVLEEIEVDSDERGARNEAEDWLFGFLADGPREASHVQAEGQRAGFSKHQIKRASTQLKVKKSKGGMRGGWSWSL